MGIRNLVCGYIYVYNLDVKRCIWGEILDYVESCNQTTFKGYFQAFLIFDDVNKLIQLLSNLHALCNNQNIFKEFYLI